MKPQPRNDSRPRPPLSPDEGHPRQSATVSPVAPHGTSFLQKVGAVFTRETRTEFRSRYALNSIGMFAVTTLVVIGFSVSGDVPRRTHAALLWLVLLFSAMTGLSRIFVREVEARTQDALRLTADPTALLLGKMAFNGMLLAGVQAVIVPLYLLMTGLPIRNPALFLAVQLLGNVGLTLSSTLLAAIVAKAGGRAALFPVLALPILMPLLFALVAGTYAALVPDPTLQAGRLVPNLLAMRESAWAAGMPYVRLALAYAGMLGPAAVLLFDLIWNED
ncbi:MAG: heme exporter protein CcmB [Armatimonadetes bacterium]|nr:heme exporter protein CcmB [Armatimonadota bacterium]